MEDTNENVTATQSALAVTVPSTKETRAVGDVRTEIISTCVAVIPTKGTNAGRQMFVINGKHWSRHAPSENDNTVVLEYAEWDGGSGWNVIGFNADNRMLSVDAKIAKIAALDPAYSQALAYLLR